MKWNGMLERVREKGPKHPWVMQTIDRLSFVEPQTENSLRSASKPRAEESVHVPNKVDNRSTEASPTRARTPRQTRNQRRLHARYRAAHSSNFTTRRWARKPLYTWLWLFQQRSRVKYHPITGDWEWENPLRRDIWWYKSAYEKPPSPASSQEPTPVVASLNEGVGSNPLPPSRMELNMDVISNSPLPEAVRVAALSEAVAQDLALTDMNIEVAGPETSRRVAMSEAVADGLVDINMESEGPGPESLALTDGPVEGEGDAMGGVEGDMEMGGGGGREKSSDVGLDAMELIGGMNGSWVGDSPGR
ncbi:MAG: hypothetical protein M1839_002349 [Geoglossum umbratile]|nr:MAG: hypothetical protein M1839_002349 [Geoglossum umbratile]